MSGNGSCGCCACLAGAGQPVTSFNRPGLSAIRYRAGTYGTFFEAMVRRLTVPVGGENDPAYSLHALTTREHDDPAIALLDAWATSGDVLTFYQERIANEAYLRTATERRSLLELGRLVGYTLKPGVAASAYLAYTVDDTATTIIPAGSKAQSIPGANEQPQMFETSEEIEARGVWNALLPRMRRPQRIYVDRTAERTDEKGEPFTVLADNVLSIDSVWIEGTDTLFEKRDPLLFVFDGEVLGEWVYAVRRVVKATPDTELDRTEIVLEPVRPYYTDLYLAALLELKSGSGAAVKLSPAAAPALAKTSKSKKKKKTQNATVPTVVPPLQQLLREILLGTSRTLLRARFEASGPVGDLLQAEDGDRIVDAPVPGVLSALFEPLGEARGRTPRGEFEFARSLAGALDARSDARLRLLTAFHPELVPTLYTAVANVSTGNQPHEQFRELHVLRREASVFGYNAPDFLFEPPDQQPRPIPGPITEDSKVLYLDTPDEKIAAGSYALIRNNDGARVLEVLETETVARAAYGISGKSSRLTLDEPWSDHLTNMPKEDQPKVPERLVALRANLVQIRTTSVLVQSEELTLAQQPVDRPVGRKADGGDTTGESETRIELDAVVDGLAAGRWVIVRGERLVDGTSGVVAAELAMVANVEQETDVGPGGTPYSILVLAPDGLAFEYERSSVQILGNVAAATHGETHAEILGSGAASQPMQTFTLHQAPLTFVAAPTVDGARSTLAVRVDDVLWHETDSLGDAAPNDRLYTTKIADDGKVSVTFGDGIHGRRIFSGSDNVRAVYRTGIGRGGNVRAGQIATAVSRPLGVKEVVNPTESSGGADPESAGEARRNIPGSLQAMGRVVSVEDFAAFARTFAGIEKATAKMLAVDRTRFVHLTIGGSGDIPIDRNSDLYRNLVESLRKYGNPYLPFVVDVRKTVVITGAARVRVGADHLWSLVAPKVRAALLDAFSYERSDFGQPVFSSEVIAAIQSVPGVEYVDLDQLVGVREENVRAAFAEPKGNAMMRLVFTAWQVADTTPGAPPAPRAPIDCDGRPAILPMFARLPEPSRASPAFPRDTLPAEIAYLLPRLADLFILTEITND